jgi:hypothetical protein
MYDPYTLDRIRFEQEARQRRLPTRQPRQSRTRYADRRHFAGVLFRRTPQPCTD